MISGSVVGDRRVRSAGHQDAHLGRRPAVQASLSDCPASRAVTKNDTTFTSADGCSTNHVINADLPAHGEAAGSGSRSGSGTLTSRVPSRRLDSTATDPSA